MVAENKSSLPRSLNISTGNGSSVKDIIGLVCEELKVPQNAIIGERRTGVPGVLIGNVELAKAELGFIAEFSLCESIKSLFVK
jgi:UDP-glucose 4-epimerase